MPLGARAARGRPALQRRLGHAALARDLDRAGPAPPPGPRDGALACSWRGCSHSSQPVALLQRGGLADSGRRGRACRRAAGRRRARARPAPARARARAASPARACRSPRARCRRPRPAPRRCSAARRGSAAAAAAATPRARPARPVRPPCAASACAGRDVPLRPWPPSGPLRAGRWASASRRRGAEALSAPESSYTGPAGDVLVLRGTMTPGDPAAVRRGGGRLAGLARGRLAARGGVPLRAPRGALGDRRHGADHAPEGAARPLSASPRPTSGAGSATCCASTSPSTSRT